MKENKLKEINLSLRILNIQLKDFNALKILPPELAEIGIIKDKVQFEFNVESRLEIEKGRIGINLNVSFFAEEEKKTNLGNLESSGDFEVLNMSDIVKDFDGKIPNVILATLIGIVISSSRGFLVLKSVGTLMEGIIMPVINANSFFPKESNIKTSK
jgi:hypothetical protein